MCILNPIYIGELDSNIMPHKPNYALFKDRNLYDLCMQNVQ